MTRNTPEQQSSINGHGAETHCGRFLLGDAAALPASELVAAMERLLSLGDVPVTSRFTALGGKRLHHIEAGNGRPLVLLHGASGGGANWYRLLRSLGASRRAIALDLPGFGLSDAVPIKSPLGRNVADLVLEWLSARDIHEFDLVATSFGSLVAMRMAQRASARVGRVALINGVGLGRELPLALRLATLSPLSSIALRPSRLGTRWQFHELMTAEGATIPREHEEALLEYLWQSAQAGDQKLMVKAFSDFSSLAGQREILNEDELRAFTHPLLLLWGAKDRFLPVEHGKRAAALVPSARLRIIPDAGHSPNWEAPEAVIECLSPFLESTSRQEEQRT